MRIFIKIFLTFWLVIVALVVVSIGLSYIQGDNSVLVRIHHISRYAFNIYAQTAVEIYERKGSNALDSYLKRINRSTNTRSYLFSNNSEISHLNAPSYAYYVMHRSERNHELDFLLKPDTYWSKEQIAGPSGKHYTFVFRTTALHPSHMIPIKRGLLLILIAAFICYLLTANITKPIISIRNAAQKLSEGKFPVSVGTGVTRRHDEIGALGRDFDIMATRIEGLLTSQKRLLADISHELRSPLARLEVALGLVRRDANNETELMLDRIEREARRMNAMIGQLSTLTMLESGFATTNKRDKINLCSLINDIVSDANFEALKKNRSVQLINTERQDWDCRITGNNELIHSAIENIIRNAVRYTNDNTTVEISLDHIASPTNTAIITIRDHGPGIPDDQLSNIFQPFFRISESRDRESGGVGLGLSIAERAIKSHGGSIAAKNAEDGGLLVEIRLPF